MKLDDAIRWYQHYIGLYEKQSWERTVEQRILQGLSYETRQSAEIESELIDVDLVRGSTFPKAKPRASLWLAGIYGILRLTFLPLFLKWWWKETPRFGFLFVVTIYCSVISCYILTYFLCADQINNVLSACEVVSPVILMLLLSCIHSQIVCTRHGRNRSLFGLRNNFKNPSKASISLNSIPKLTTYSKKKYSTKNSDKNKNYSRKNEKRPLYNKRSNSEEAYPEIILSSNTRSSSENNLTLYSSSHIRYPNIRTYLSPGNRTEDISEGVSDVTGDTGGSGDLDSPVEYLSSPGTKCSCRCGQLRSKGVRSKPKHHRSFGADDLSDCSDGNSSAESDAAEISTDMSFLPSKLPRDSCDDLNYSSESEVAWDDFNDSQSQLRSPRQIDWHIQGAPAAIIPTAAYTADKVSCKIWDGSETNKVDLSVLDISSAVISKTEHCPHSLHYLIFGIIISCIISFLPNLLRWGPDFVSWLSTEFIFSLELGDKVLHLIHVAVETFIKSNKVICLLVILTVINRLTLMLVFFFLLSVAERTFKQRFLYAKHFSYLTSARRARKYGLPHFRLHKVINIKSWLSIRSCLKKCGPGHSVDVIVNMSFMLSLILVSYLTVELLKEDDHQYTIYSCELYVWCFAISIYLIRFMTLGAAINKKYRNLSVLITEQINLYLHMEQKPQKKEELTLANNVLKLVSDLLKELDSPFKISGLSANPLLYNVTKLVVLSACSGLLSDMLGFKLKLHKIKFI